MPSEPFIRALTLEMAGGPESVALRQQPLPMPAPNEVRVRLRAAALNHREVWITRGMYPGMILPATLGADGAGVIEAVGDGVDNALLGQAVVLYPGLEWGDDPAIPSRSFALLGMPGPGTIADAICVRADRLAPKPAHLDFEAAAAIPLAGLTAWRGLFVKAGLKPGQTLLVTGAGGGVAGMALRLAIAMGVNAYVTSSSVETIAQAVAAGARGGVDYREPGWGKALAKLSGGVDVVLDGAPAAGFSEYVRALAPGGRVVIYGASAGGEFMMRAPELFLKNITVMGTNVGTLEEFRDMVQFVADHAIVPLIDRSFRLEESPQAIAYLDTQHGAGKVVITI